MTRAKRIYCAICAGKHTEEKCPNKVFSKNYHLNSVRERFANATAFRPVGEDVQSRYNKSQNNRNSHSRNNS